MGRAFAKDWVGASMSLEEEVHRLQYAGLLSLGEVPAPRSRRSHSNSSERTRTSSGSASGSTSGSPTSTDELFKTELCRSFESTGACKYGTKCRFAHGQAELRPVARHPKYKTQHCKTFREQGHCPYGARCKFIHSDQEESPLSAPGLLEHSAMAKLDLHRDRRSASVDGAAMAAPQKQLAAPMSRSSSEFSPRSPLGQMSPFQDLSPRSPELHRRGSPRAGAETRTSPRVRGHATVVVGEDDTRFAFPTVQKKERLPIFKGIAGEGAAGASAAGNGAGNAASVATPASGDY